MIKNIVISILAAVLAVEVVPWFAVCDTWEKTGIFIGICIPLIIFCFFCQETAEKAWNKHIRAKRMGKKIEKLRRTGA